VGAAAAVAYLAMTTNCNSEFQGANQKRSFEIDYRMRFL
jgi:hypothetical protein